MIDTKTVTKPDCLIAEGNGWYRCPRFGFRRQTHELLILCACPDGKVLTNEEVAAATAKPTQQLPSVATMAWNLTKSLAAFVADGCKTVDADEYQRRLTICDSCEHRLKDKDRCVKCGCYLSMKAKGRAFECPEKKWEERGHEVPPTSPAT